MIFRGRTILQLGGLASLLSACQFQASASAAGDAKTGADAQGSWQASVQPPLQPAAPQPAERTIHFEAGRLAYKGIINFEYDKANLMTDEVTKTTLREFQEYLQKFPEVHLEIEGHTDSRGSDDYNRDLSNRRAATVKGWLVEHGIDPSRLTSVGKGEDQPQIPEPIGCKDQHPEDTKPCEETWAKNRRVVFEVTKGADVLQKAEAAPAVAPTPLPPPAPPPQVLPLRDTACPWLWGGHLNAAGPNSWVTVAAATQPGVCWLELSLGLGLGLGFGTADAEAAGLDADGSYVSFTVPLRGRFWFMNRHSLIGDLGVGVTHYRISSDAEDAAGNSFEYTRNTTPFIAHAGLGYGFRPNGSEAGFRLALVLGGLLHLTELGDSDVDVASGFAGATATELQNALDDDSDELSDIEPYAEVSFGLLF